MSDHVYNYSSTQFNITGNLKKEILRFHSKIKKDNLYTAEDGYGFESEPHVTILYGLHTNKPTSIIKLIKDRQPVTITLGKVSRFSNENKPFDVIKIDVDSADLEALHNLIADNEKVTSDFKDYHAHITLAYVKKGKHKDLTGDKTFVGKSQVGEEVIFSSSTGDRTKIRLNCKANSELHKKGFIARLNEMGVSYEKSVQAQSFLHGRISELFEAGAKI